MNADAVDRSCTSASLSREQKQRLAILSREAWERQPERVRRGEGTATARFNLWRHAQAIKCCGRRISEAVQGDFLPLKAHFLDLAGKPVAAMQAHMRRETEPQRVALHKLTRECEAKGLAIGYAAAICRTQYRCGLEEANEKQLWRLVYTVRNRRKAAATPRPSRAPLAEEPLEDFSEVNDDDIPF
jgi:hypothetical protein